jgi:hypothetical protein
VSSLGQRGAEVRLPSGTAASRSFIDGEPRARGGSLPPSRQTEADCFTAVIDGLCVALAGVPQPGQLTLDNSSGRIRVTDLTCTG